MPDCTIETWTASLASADPREDISHAHSEVSATYKHPYWPSQRPYSDRMDSFCVGYGTTVFHPH